MNDIDIISSQTGINDRALIERYYIECNNSVVDTIMKLMDYRYCKEPIQKEYTVFDNIRDIMLEKETLFLEVMKQAKGQT